LFTWPKSPRLLVVILVLVLWGVITHGTYAGSGDDLHYEIMAHSLAFDRDLDLANNYVNERNLAFGEHPDPTVHVGRGKDGRIRPLHDLGLPVLFVPYYMLAYELTRQIVQHVPASWLQRAKLNFRVTLRHLLSLAMIGITAWLGVTLFKVFVDISNNSARAFAWTVLLVVSPPLLSFSSLFFTEIVSAIVALLILLWIRRPSSGRFAALAAGAATGYVFLLHARNVGLFAGLLAVAVYRSRFWSDERMRRASFLGGVATLLLVRTAVTYHFWGTWVTTPDARFDIATPPVGESLTRLAGWLFDQEHGLLPYAPLYLLVPAGWLALWTRDHEFCVDLSVVMATYVGIMTVPLFNAHGWRGGWSPAARYLVPIAPMLGILAFSAAAYAPRLPAIARSILALQVALDVILWQHPKLLWNDGVGASALCRYLDGGTGRLSSYAPSLTTPIGFRTITVIVSIVIAWAVITALVKGSSATSVAGSRWCRRKVVLQPTSRHTYRSSSVTSSSGSRTTRVDSR
jgi:hypothetical protein